MSSAAGPSSRRIKASSRTSTFARVILDTRTASVTDDVGERAKVLLRSLAPCVVDRSRSFRAPVSSLELVIDQSEGGTSADITLVGRNTGWRSVESAKLVCPSHPEVESSALLIVQPADAATPTGSGNPTDAVLAIVERKSGVSGRLSGRWETIDKPLVFRYTDDQPPSLSASKLNTVIIPSLVAAFDADRITSVSSAASHSSGRHDGVLGYQDASSVPAVQAFDELCHRRMLLLSKQKDTAAE